MSLLTLTLCLRQQSSPFLQAEAAVRTLRRMSALPPNADIDKRDGHVRFVPKADIRRLIRSTRRRAQEMSSVGSGPVPQRSLN